MPAGVAVPAAVAAWRGPSAAGPSLEASARDPRAGGGWGARAQEKSALLGRERSWKKKGGPGLGGSELGPHLEEAFEARRALVAEALEPARPAWRGARRVRAAGLGLGTRAHRPSLA